MIYIPEVNVIERDFQPVVELCHQIADFLESVQTLSWTQRRYSYKKELVEKAKAFTLRVDEINCQVIIQLNAYSNQSRDRGQSSDEDDDASARDVTSVGGRRRLIHNLYRNNDFLIGSAGMIFFLLVAMYIHLYFD